jgi:UDP-glucuronate 4-epimerase
MSITCLRYFTVYGPRQRPDLAIHKFARLIEEGKPIPVFGDGSMMRDFTYIDDIIDGTIAAMDKCVGFNIYNIGNSEPISVNKLIIEIEKTLGKKAIRQYLPMQPGDVQRTFADITKAAHDLAYHPKTDIYTGLAKFVSWLSHDEFC